MADARSLEVADLTSFGLVPPCADPRFDHRTCDYWEDADRGSKAARPGWLSGEAPPPPPPRSAVPDNPFAPPPRQSSANPFLDEGSGSEVQENPFAPTRTVERPRTSGVPRKLALLDRGRGVFGSYARVLIADDVAVAYCQFGPLSAYPRAIRLRDLYPQLPSAPLPAVITCIATTAEARRQGWARRLVDEVCADLAGRGFAAVEAYPDLTRPEDETSAGRPAFWHAAGFTTAVDDERFPVMRRELD
jgi:ribosomal protein S18 acetylase RimI-like enzyme